MPSNNIRASCGVCTPETTVQQQVVNPAIVAPKPFRFLALPPEIRNIIYFLLLVSKYYTTIQFYRLPSKHDKRVCTHQSVSTAILSVNRQIYSEAVGILYGENKFLGDAKCLNTFLERLSSKSKNRLQHLEFYRVQLSGLRSTLHQLKRAPSLTTISLNMYVRTSFLLDAPDGLTRKPRYMTHHSPRKLANYCRPFVRARLKANRTEANKKKVMEIFKFPSFSPATKEGDKAEEEAREYHATFLKDLDYA